MKYILVTGGMMSGIGKGVVTSSIGAVLTACDLRVTAIKIDPYLNIDAGTLSPHEHGEVFVLDDGCEVDLDLGNYERFLGTNLCQSNNITTGKVYQQVIRRERQGGYLGATVTIIPHLTDAIQKNIEDTAAAQEADVCLIELGGTIGDIEVQPYLEALRQLSERVKPADFCCFLVNPVPCFGKSQEHKTKPTQASVRALRNCGIAPDVIVCRSEKATTQSVREKISFLCGVKRVIDMPDLETIYQVPTELERQGIVAIIASLLQMPIKEPCLKNWSTISDVAINSSREIVIALVGKYTRLTDCYTSVNKALEHACYRLGAKPKIVYLESDQLEKPDTQAWANLAKSDCVIVPGGFGIRGTEGKMKAIEFARKNKKPFLGICLGFQLAAIEYARNVLSITGANSAEFDEDLKKQGLEYKPIVIEMLDYVDPQRKLGGTMRLGLKKTIFVCENSIVRHLYDDQPDVDERHRHRYEINPDYIQQLEEGGLRFVGKNDDGSRMEILELDENEHPYFVAVQFHPEYKTRPFKPSPPYFGLIETAARLKFS